MCIAIPAKVIEINGDSAKVNFGEGTSRIIDISLVDANKGDYVIVHAGFAIQVMDYKAANETIQIWKKILKEDNNIGRSSI
jgi:hydrogenase expression/formation protein HypC